MDSFSLNDFLKKYYFLSKYKPLQKPFAYIYIYYNPTYGKDDTFYKIGITINLKTRLSNLNNAQLERGFYCYISNITFNYDLADTILKYTFQSYSHFNEVYNISIYKAINIIDDIVNDVNFLNLIQINKKYFCLFNTKFYITNNMIINSNHSK